MPTTNTTTTTTTTTAGTRRAVVAGSTLSAGVVLALALYAMANYLAMRHYARFDWTASEIYTLSEKSENVVRQLDRDVEAVVFLSPAAEVYPAVDELLDRYQAANPERFQKRVIDPAKDLLEARRLVERFEIDRENVVVLVSGDERRVIEEYELAELDYSGAQFGQPPRMTAFKGEQLITSAVLELVEASKPKIVFTTGHGEAPLSPGSQRSLAQAKAILGEDNFEIEEWGSLGADAVPAGTDLVVVAGPTSGFLPPEIELLDRYLAGGGRLLFLLDPAFSDSLAAVDLGLGDFLRRHGVELRDDVVIDPGQQLPFFGPETIFTSTYGSHPVVDDLAKANVPVLFTLARSLAEADGDGDRQVTPLVRSSDEGWGETDLDTPQVSQGEGDHAGPVTLAMAVSFGGEREGEGEMDGMDGMDGMDEEESTGNEAEAPEEGAGEARLVVFGDLDFAADAQIGSGANANLLLNAFNWLVQREELIAIDPRQIEETRISLSGPELRNLTWIVLALMPGAAIAAGVTVFLRRRR